MEPRPLAPGDVVAGKYLIESILGEGGMGYVLGARNITLDEPVAIKILKPDAVADGEAVARFLREARAAVRMKGEHVARVLDVGALEDGTPYMLMELLQGSDLSTIVERDGHLPVQVAVDYVLQVCEALAEAHGLGIVHRDIKPSNLFLTTGVDGLPCLKVLDFGISKATNAIDATRPDFGLTQTQTVMGSPQYMAPEQMRSSRRVDGRTDIWGLGTIMHELLTGIPPFDAPSMPELFAMILQDPAPSLRGLRPDVPPELDAVVLQCLEKSPEKRPESVLELARLLMPFAGPMSVGAAERVGRVGRSVAFASATLIAAASARESTASLARPKGLVISPDPPGSAPSAPELAHARTTAFAEPPVPGARPRGRLGLVFGLVAAAMVVIGGSLTAVSLMAKRHRTEAGPSVAATAGASGVALAVDLSPAAEAPPSSAQTAATAAPSPLPAAVTLSAASTTAVKRDAGAPAARPRVGASSATSASAASAAPPTVAPTRPAATASSRFD
jgi:serine/threonine-protein kinase